MRINFKLLEQPLSPVLINAVQVLGFCMVHIGLLYHARKLDKLWNPCELVRKYGSSKPRNGPTTSITVFKNFNTTTIANIACNPQNVTQIDSGI